MTDQVEEFFIQRFSGASKPTTICINILKTVGRSIALRKLSSVLDVLRNERSLLRLDKTASSAQIWRWLKLSEKLTTAGVYFRRLYLVQLVDRHKKLLEECKRSDNQPDADCSDRAASQALDLLTKEIFPSDQHRGSAGDEQNRKKVQNCLCAGRKWDRFVSTHSLVIVLLVATGPRLGLNSQE